MKSVSFVQVLEFSLVSPGRRCLEISVYSPRALLQICSQNLVSIHTDAVRFTSHFIFLTSDLWPFPSNVSVKVSVN